ncbi:hypothetical protein BJX61DRAFT_428419 [Aspergillus egyptiacus]|nr:hypothetical protein BJX61DRAFT_428419 [Aspergillus egyptiacus]
MWGKVSFHRSRKPASESPPPANTRHYQSSSTPVSQDGGISSKALPTLPSGRLDFPATVQYDQDSNRRVASSVYSRDTAIYDHIRQRSISDTYGLHPQSHAPINDNGYSQGMPSVDISPLNSPVGSRSHSRASSGVSSMGDEMSWSTPKGGKIASHIPVPRKRVDSQPGNPQSTKPPLSTAATRWDHFSGEPTTSQQGRVGQVNPSSVTFKTEVSASPMPSHGSKILDWGKHQLHSRKKGSETRNRRYGSNEPAPFVPREPWKGPSGREPMVTPIQEQPRNTPGSRLRLSKSNERLREMNNPSPRPGIAQLSTVTTTITAGKENNKQEPRKKFHGSREVEGNASAGSGNNAPPRVDLAPGPDLSAGLTGLALVDNDAHEPASRFSVTTYAPTEVASPAPSPRQSLASSPPPSIIDTASQSSDTAQSIMSRARPVPSAIVPGKRPVRKPTPSEVPSDKELPPNPAEMTAQGRIGMLEARRDDLARRRANINTIIYELTQVIQPSSVAYDMAAREEVKKTVSSLNNELAEIKKEEHEIGLKLLRAWKKREDEDFFGQSSSLWVRRVTS